MSEPQQNKKVLVYGTLRPGNAAFDIFDLAEQTNHIGSVRIPGSMYHLGGFPGVKLDGAEPGVVCDVLEILNPDVMTSLDRYEGYHEDRPEHSLYLKREVDTAEFGSCMIYEYNNEIGGRPKMEDGDWNKRSIG
jgi:gamma-glutamylcyclotransferase (GGCT)/AIG2-like uncharacterized protein YtfP